MDYQDYPPPLTCKGGSFEPLEPPLLRVCIIQHCRKTLHSRTKETRLVIQIQKIGTLIQP